MTEKSETDDIFRDVSSNSNIFNKPKELIKSIKRKVSKEMKKKLHIKINKSTLFLLCIILVLSATLIVRPTYDPEKVINTRNVLSIMGSHNWEDMTDADSKYHKMMITILAHHSLKHSKERRKWMTKEEKISYMRKNLEFAKELHMPVFTVPTIHCLEGNFNPFAEGGYGEKGMCQMKWATYTWCETIQRKFMQPSMRKLLYIDAQSHKDLFDPIIALKATYTLLWYLDNHVYHGREDWTISAYHWGGFLDRRWDKGEGEIPTFFILNGIEYNVIKYYFSFQELKDAFENGQIDVSKAIVAKYRKDMDKLAKQDVEYNKLMRVIRAQRKTIKELEQIDIDRAEKVKKIDALAEKTLKEFEKIGGEARDNGWNATDAYEKLKNKCKQFLKERKITDKNFVKENLWLIIIIGGSILLTIIISVITKILRGRGSEKWQKNKKPMGVKKY